MKLVIMMPYNASTRFWNIAFVFNQNHKICMNSHANLIFFFYLKLGTDAGRTLLLVQMKQRLGGAVMEAHYKL